MKKLIVLICLLGIYVCSEAPVFATDSLDWVWQDTIEDTTYCEHVWALGATCIAGVDGVFDLGKQTYNGEDAMRAGRYYIPARDDLLRRKVCSKCGFVQIERRRPTNYDLQKDLRGEYEE